MKSIHKFSDVTNLIEKQRQLMFETNPFFKTLADESLGIKQRMLFMPYMLFFSCGGPDVITLLMQQDKPVNHMNFIEKKINAFINEDNFHYNFYLQDLETMGYTMEKFGSVNAVVRHIYAQEAIPVRKLVYSLGHYSHQNQDPLLRLTLCELIEAGLFDLFVTIYKRLVKKENSPIANLHYFGDTHVNLEMNHTVTTWFSGNESDVADLDIPAYIAPLLVQAVTEIMDNFNEMYLAFHEIIIKGDTIFPKKYDISNQPPIHQITNKQASPVIDNKKIILQESLVIMKDHKDLK